QQPAQQGQGRAPITPEKLLSEAVEWFYKKKEPTTNPPTLKKYYKIQREFLAYVGDCSVTSIYRYHLDQYREHLQFEDRNTVTTIKNKFSALNLLFEELIHSGYYTQANPAEHHVSYGPRQKQQRSKQLSKVAFTSCQLQTIFSPETSPAKSPSEF